MDSRWNIAQALALLGGEQYPGGVSAAKGAAKAEVSTAVGLKTGACWHSGEEAPEATARGLAAAGSGYDGSCWVMLGSGSVRGEQWRR